MYPLVSASDVGAFTSAVLGMCAVLGLLVRFVLLPYLRDQVVKPVRETHRQVTVNQHRSNTPTVVDRIDDVLSKVADLDAKVDNLGAEATAAAAVGRAAARSANAAHRRLEAHISWANEEDHRLWSTVRRQEGTNPDESSNPRGT